MNKLKQMAHKTVWQMTLFNPAWLLVLINLLMTYILDHAHQIATYIAASPLHWYSYMTYGFFSLNPLVWFSNAFAFIVLGMIYVYLRENKSFKQTVLQFNGIWFTGSIFGGLLASFRLPGLFILGPSAGLAFLSGVLLTLTLLSASTELRLKNRLISLAALIFIIWFEASGVAPASRIIHNTAFAAAILSTFIYLIGCRVGRIQKKS